MKRQVRVSPKRDLEEPETEPNGNKRAKLLLDESDKGNHLEVDKIKGKSLDHLKDNGSHNHTSEDQVQDLSQNEQVGNENSNNNKLPAVNEPNEQMSSNINGNGTMEDESNDNQSNVDHNGICDAAIVKSLSTGSEIISEEHSKGPPSNSEKKDPQSSEHSKSMPVLNAVKLDIHNSESTDSFQSEGFETTKSSNESENNKCLDPCPSQEVGKHSEGDSIVSQGVSSSVDIDSLTLSQLEVTQLEGHADVIYSVAADEDFVLSSSGDTTVKVWSMVDKSLKCNFSGHKHCVTALLLLSQSQSDVLANKLEIPGVSRIAITGSLDCQIKLWDLLEGSELLTIYTFNGITCLGYLESESYIIVGTDGGKLELWNPSTKEVVQSVRAHEDYVTDIKVHDCSIYSVSHDGAVKVWLFEELEIYPVYTRKRKERLSQDKNLGPAQWKAVATSDHIMYLGDKTNSIKVLDSVAGRLRLFRNQAGIEGICKCIAVDKDILLTSYFDSSSDTGGVNVWKIPDMTYICTLSGEVQDIWSLAIVRKAGKLRIVTGGDQLLVWDFDFSKPPTKDSHDSHHVDELDLVGQEMDENNTNASKNDTSNQSITSNPNENINNRWCSVM